MVLDRTCFHYWKQNLPSCIPSFIPQISLIYGSGGNNNISSVNYIESVRNFISILLNTNKKHIPTYNPLNVVFSIEVWYVLTSWRIPVRLLLVRLLSSSERCMFMFASIFQLVCFCCWVAGWWDPDYRLHPRLLMASLALACRLDY